MKYYSATDIGRVREKNEDAFLANPPVFAVADGLGGHLAGEVASSLALSLIEKELKEPVSSREELIDKMVKAIEEVNRSVYERSREKPDYRGMGTTLTLAYQLEDKLYFLHVGDSRAYLFRREKLYRLTEDHSVVFQMFKEGQISKEEMETHPLRSTLTQAIGVSPTVRADVVAVKTQPGDRYLLATDGLTSMLKDEEIEEILKRNLSLEESCQTLIEAANSKGGYDNITLVLLEIEAA